MSNKCPTLDLLAVFPRVLTKYLSIYYSTYLIQEEWNNRARIPSGFQLNTHANNRHRHRNHKDQGRPRSRWLHVYVYLEGKA